MKKVFIIHGFQGSPNGGWRPWLMAELEKLDVYACALPMPNPENPICEEWIEEIARHVEKNKEDEIYLIGHSLGSPAILRYLEAVSQNIKNIVGVILVSCLSEKNNNRKIDNFLDKPFNFSVIKSKTKKFVFIHGDNDPDVPLCNAEFLSKELGGELIIIPNGGHLNGSSGFFILPECLDAFKNML